jgi:hypothetical protein
LKTFGIADVTDAEQGATPNIGGLRDLIATLRVFYGAIGGCALLILLTAGTAWIWHITRPLDAGRPLRLAWLVYACGFSLNFSRAYWSPLLSGVNRVVAVERIITASAIVNLLVAGIGLCLGFGIWSLVTSTVLMGLMNWSIPRHCFIKATAGKMECWHSGRARMDQLKAIWPTTWRTVICAAGTFLAMPATIFVSSGALGLKTTASFGLSLQLLIKVSAFSSVWIRVKLPVLSRLRAHGEGAELAALFARRFRNCMLTALAGAVGIVLFIPVGLAKIDAPTRLLPAPQLILLCVAAMLRVQETQFASLVLTENENPFARRVFLTGALVFSCGAIVTPIVGIYGVLLSMVLIPAAYSSWSIPLRALAGLRVSAEALPRA